MADKRVIIALAIALAAPAEGLRQLAYRDPVGILTVCYGHTGADVKQGQKKTLDQCKAILSEDMRVAVDQVEKCHAGLPEKVHAAFADAAFNIGPTVACNSTASRFLGAGNYRAACDQLLKWDKAKVAGVYVALPGLTKRRKAERDLCMEDA